jgi:ABC-2 type transport system ATP-binding protein
MNKNNKKYIVEVEELTKMFGNFTAVNKISFNVSKGEIFGFLGANGAGKTTAIKILCGLLSPTSGKAVVAGYDVYKSAEDIKKTIGYMSQKFSLYDDLTVEENITLFGGIYELSNEQIKEKREFLIKKLELEEVKDKLLRD